METSIAERIAQVCLESPSTHACIARAEDDNSVVITLDDGQQIRVISPFGVDGDPVVLALGDTPAMTAASLNEALERRRSPTFADVWQLLHEQVGKRRKNINGEARPWTSCAGPSKDDASESSDDSSSDDAGDGADNAFIDDDDYDAIVAGSPQAWMTNMVRAACRELGVSFSSFGKPWCRVSLDNVTVILHLDLGQCGLHEPAAALLGLSLCTCLVVRLRYATGDGSRANPNSWECLQHTHTLWGGGASADEPVGSFGIRTYVPRLIERALVQPFASGEAPLSGLALRLKASLAACCESCPICFKRHESAFDRLQPCSSASCLFSWEELPTGSLLAQLRQYRLEPLVFTLELAMTAATAQNADGVFEPFPSFLLRSAEMRGRSGVFEPGKSVEQRLPGSGAANPAPPSAAPSAAPVASTPVAQNKRLPTLAFALRVMAPLAQKMLGCTSDAELSRLLMQAWDENALEWQLFAKQDAWSAEELQAVGEGAILRKVLRYVINTDRSVLVALEGPRCLPQIEATRQFAVAYSEPEREAAFSRRRATFGSTFAFHGAPSAAWFSILRNSLRSMSGSALMRHGAVFGKGIYLAKEVQLSLSYTASRGINAATSHVVALCEVINLPEYKKGYGLQGHVGPARDMYVVPVETDVIIRYIFTGTKSSSQPAHQVASSNEGHLDQVRAERKAASRDELVAFLANMLPILPAIDLGGDDGDDEDFDDSLVAGSSASGGASAAAAPSRAVGAVSLLAHGNGNANATRLILREYKRLASLQASGKADGICVDIPDDANVYRWRALLTPPADTPLAKELRTHAEATGAHAEAAAVTLEIIFTEAFPMAPPFVRVVSPRFAFHSGHVTIGGSICMELLTNSGWSPAFTIESVLVQIRVALVEGEGRLDRTRAHIPYELAEAREAFRRVAAGHGWNVA